MFVFVFHTVTAQENGTFDLSLGGQNELKVIGDTTKQYDAITFRFSKDLNNLNFNLSDVSKTVSFFSSDKTLGSDIQKNASSGRVQVTILNDNGKYIVDGFSDIELPGDFLIKIKDLYAGPFHLKPKNSDNGKSKVLAHQPGFIFYDALYINENWKKHNFDTIKLILAFYKLDPTTIKSNRFLNNSLKDIFSKKTVNIEGGGSLTPANLATSAGNLDVTTLADGFAKFIVTRTKQELSIAFFNKFKTMLSDPKYVDLQTVFPETYKTLSAIGDEIYMYNAYLQTLRESFEKDLAALPSNLPTLLDNHKTFFDSLPGLRAVLKTGFYLTQQIQDKQHPGNIIENFPVENLIDSAIDPNIPAAFQTLQLLSTSLKSNTDTLRYWASNSDIKKLFSNDTVLLEIYFGLLEQQAKSNRITFHDKNGQPRQLSDIIDSLYPSVTNDLPKYKAYIKNMVLKIQNLETKVAGLKTKGSDSLNIENYYGLVSSSIDLMKYLTQVENIPHFPDGLDIQKKTGIYFYAAQTSANIVIDVNRKNYSSAILDAKQLYDTIFTDTNIEDFVSRSKKDSKLCQKDLADTIKTEKEKSKTTINAFFKYGSFMAVVAMAKNSDDVEAAIETVALPAGSASIKKETPLNIALNAYCGVFGGYEQIIGVDPGWMAKSNTFANSYGITAPIGVSLSEGKCCWVPIFGAFFGEGRSSHSLFLSVVDIGALAAFRFVDDSTKSAPSIQLRDIISPGLFYSVGIPDWPLSVNFGWQQGPLLRQVTKTENNYSQSYSRISLSVCVDIPMLNFYTTPND